MSDKRMMVTGPQLRVGDVVYGYSDMGIGSTIHRWGYTLLVRTSEPKRHGFRFDNSRGTEKDAWFDYSGDYHFEIEAERPGLIEHIDARPASQCTPQPDAWNAACSAYEEFAKADAVAPEVP